MAVIRSLGTIIPNITIEESHDDSIEITNHPVQQGAAISDHSYKNPSSLKVQYGFNVDINIVYEKLLKLQTEGTLLEVVTGRRNYKNMLIKSLSTTTNNKTNQILFIAAELKEVIIVSTQTGSVPPRDRQSNAGRTGQTPKAGTKQAKTIEPDAKKKSALSILAGG